MAGGPVFGALAPTILIRNALIVDGSGAPAFAGAVRIDNGRIIEVGALEPRPSDHIVNARGLALAPGFIDTHSHAVDQETIGSPDHYLPHLPDALTVTSQGVTTLVVGQDGRSYLPLGPGLKRLASIRTAVNVASLVGHGTIRLQVMGDDFKREARGSEVEAMRTLVSQAMTDGAFGLSTGLEYNPGIYSSRDEVRLLAEEAGRHGGIYVSHIRSEDRDFWPAIEEVIEIGRRNRMPVHISHIKLGMRDIWGQTERLLTTLEAARAQGVRISGDVYPYDFWRTTLTALFPQRNYRDREAAQFALDHVAPAAGIRFIHYRNDPTIVGKTLAEVAVERHMSEADALMSLIVDVPTPEEYEYETMAGMSQPDVDRIMQWPQANICSDGSLVDSHPRGAGTFTKILRDAVRERHLLSLEAAVKKMTSVAAANLEIPQRGLVRPGYFADLVLFDPHTVTDRATVTDPHALSAGIATVWVNGEVVFADGKSTQARPGTILRHAPTPPR